MFCTKTVASSRPASYSGVHVLRVASILTLVFIAVSHSQPTSPHRGWFVPPFGGNPWWVYLASALPALLVTILIFMDQQITAVIVNRKEHKLKVSLTPFSVIGRVWMMKFSFKLMLGLMFTELTG